MRLASQVQNTRSLPQSSGYFVTLMWILRPQDPVAGTRQPDKMREVRTGVERCSTETLWQRFHIGFCSADRGTYHHRICPSYGMPLWIGWPFADYIAKGLRSAEVVRKHYASVIRRIMDRP